MSTSTDGPDPRDVDARDRHARTGDHGRRPAPRPGRVNLNKPIPRDDDAIEDGGYARAGDVIDAEPIEEGDAARPGTAVVLAPRPGPVRRAGVVVAHRAVAVAVGTRVVVTHPHTKAGTKLVARNLWYPVAGAGVVARRYRDAHGASRYERLMHRAELAGDQEALREWEARDVAEKARRHDRVMDWVRSPVELVKAVAIGIAAFTGLLLVLGIVLALGTKDIAQVLAPIIGVINLVMFIAWFLTAYGALLLTAATVGGVVYLWHTGRAHTTPPAWVVAPTAGDEAGSRDVVPDEGAILNALRNLNIPALNRKIKEGWTPRWIMPTIRDGKGWRTQLLLPEGVNVEKINDSKDVLAHNLLRLPIEVWPTEPRDKPGVLDLWVADQGSLTKPVEPWPLLRTGTVDIFRGVPVGIDPMGKTVLGRFIGCNWGVAGTMGSGKSTLIITALLGAMLDPLVDIDVYCMAINADYDPLKPRLRTLFRSDEAEEIPRVLDALKQLMSDLSVRGRILSEAGEPKLTRELAQANPLMRPRVVVIDECQELFISEVGAEAAELVVKIVAKARKYGVTLLFATPVPSADSLPRSVAKVLSNRACFAIGDHQGNDAILGTGKHKAGITATTLRPMTEDGDGNVDLGDIGTAMTVGFSPRDGLMRCYYPRRGSGVDEVTPIVERAMALLAESGHTIAPVDAAPAGPDPLADIGDILTGHKRLRTQEVLAALAARNHTVYTGWTPGRLKAFLAEHDVRIVKSPEGHSSVRAEDVHEALATRLLAAHPDHQAADHDLTDDVDDADEVDTDSDETGVEWDSAG